MPNAPVEDGVKAKGGRNRGSSYTPLGEKHAAKHRAYRERGRIIAGVAALVTPSDTETDLSSEVKERNLKLQQEKRVFIAVCKSIVKGRYYATTSEKSSEAPKAGERKGWSDHM